MSSLKTLIREIHRRSLWQVLGVYLFASWGALQVVEVVTESVGLPDWAPGLAFVLLVIGMPMVLATAIVQEGLPGGGPESQGEAADRDEPAGRDDPAGGDHATESEPAASSAAAGVPAPSPRPGAHHRLFTWRNAVLGGVGAFALLGVAVTAYFVMWTTGVGPVGSLVAQGVFDERERVVLADFENSSEDAGLGAVVTEALRIDLLQSPALRVVEAEEIAAVLRRMARDADEALTADVAREVAVREGIKAVIEGEVGSAGSGFVLTASIREAESGRTLAAFRETAGGGDEVIDAIDKLSQRIRERAGESLRSIRSGGPLGEVTTPSLDALRRYTQADQAIDAGDDREGIALLEQALARDSTFAMAWRKLAVILQNNQMDPLRVRDAATRAYELRDRLTERERYQAEAYYHSVVTGDLDREMEAYRHVLRLEPDDGIALNNLALLYQETEQFELAEELLSRAVSGQGRSINAELNRIVNLVRMGRLEEAPTRVEAFEERYGDVAFTAMLKVWIASAAGDEEALEDALRAALERDDLFPTIRQFFHLNFADLALRRGHLATAEAHWGEILEIASGQAAGPELDFRAGRAFDRILLDLDPERGLEEVEAALERGRLQEAAPVTRPYLPLTVLFALHGRTDRARALLDEWEREVPAELRGARFEEERGLARAFIASGGQAGPGVTSAVRRLQDANRCRVCFRPMLAALYERSGETERAIAEYEALLSSFEGDRNGFNTALALQRLGPLYEEAGDTAKAADAYARFAELWADADSELQPRVRHARERAAALGGDA